MIRALPLLLLFLAACGTNSPLPPEPVDAGNDAGASARYKAYPIISALDRIGITRETDAPLSCTRLILVSPSGAPNEDGGFTAPGTWHLGGVTTTDHDCADGGNGPNVASSLNVFGGVVFHGDGGYGYPSNIDLHATAFFTQADGGFPPSTELRFDADALVVE